MMDPESREADVCLQREYHVYVCMCVCVLSKKHYNSLPCVNHGNFCRVQSNYENNLRVCVPDSPIYIYVYCVHVLFFCYYSFRCSAIALLTIVVVASLLPISYECNVHNTHIKAFYKIEV